MTDIRTKRKPVINRASSQSPSKFIPNFKKPSTHISTETFLKSFISFDKQSSPSIFPYKVKETFLTSTKSIRTPSKRLNNHEKPIRSLSKKHLKLNRVKTATTLSPERNLNEEDPRPKPGSRFLFPKSVKGVFQLEELSSPQLDFYTELSENTRENYRKANKNSLNLFKDVQTSIEESELKEYKSKYLNEQSLRSLLEQFDLPQVLRDYILIDRLVSHLDFFQKFSPEVRLRIYSSCQLVHFLPGQYIFKQGDVGDFVYVILKGSVSIEKTLKDLAPYDLVVNSIYDGKHFGDLSLLSHLLKQPNKLRQASCISSEDSYFFMIPKDSYAEILFSVQKQEIEEKIEFFASVKLFQGLPLSSISNISTNVTVMKFQLDDVILKEGEIPKGLYIIFSGYAVLYTQGFRVQRSSLEFFNATRKRKGKKQDQESIVRRALVNNLGPLTPRTLERMKGFLNPNDYQKDVLVTREWKENVSLHPREYFGGRVLLQADDQHPSLASKFTVKAKSAELQLFLIDKFQLQHFSDEVIQQVKTILSKSFEVDCPPEVNPQKLTSNFKEWLDFKTSLSFQINRDRFLNRHKNDYPFIRK